MLKCSVIWLFGFDFFYLLNAQMTRYIYHTQNFCFSWKSYFLLLCDSNCYKWEKVVKMRLGEFSQKDVFFFFWKQNQNRYLLDLQGTMWCCKALIAGREGGAIRSPRWPRRTAQGRAGDALGESGGLPRPLFSGRWMLRGSSRGFPAL